VILIASIEHPLVSAHCVSLTPNQTHVAEVPQKAVFSGIHIFYYPHLWPGKDQHPADKLLLLDGF
jgi:hypothetical protein